MGFSLTVLLQAVSTKKTIIVYVIRLADRCECQEHQGTNQKSLEHWKSFESELFLLGVVLR